MSSSDAQQAENKKKAGEVAKQAEDGIVNSPSLMAMAREISGDLTNLSAIKDEIQKRIDSLDEKSYKKQQWTAEMHQAHQEYHELAEAIGGPRQAYEDARRATSSHTSWDQYAKRAELAINWGKAVLK